LTLYFYGCGVFVVFIIGTPFIMGALLPGGASFGLLGVLICFLSSSGEGMPGVGVAPGLCDAVFGLRGVGVVPGAAFAGGGIVPPGTGVGRLTSGGPGVALAVNVGIAALFVLLLLAPEFTAAPPQPIEATLLKAAKRKNVFFIIITCK